MNPSWSEGSILTHNAQRNSQDSSDLRPVLEIYLNKLDYLEHTNQISFEQKTYYTELLAKFSGFNLGRFLLKNKGLNGFWADYLINYPDLYKKFGHDPFGVAFTPAEQLLLEKLPITVATQERHKIFKKLSQGYIRNNARILSLPCGLASEILQLDYSQIDNIELYGVDIDPESLELAEQRAQKVYLNQYCTWLAQDAWNFALPNIEASNSLDLIISNGLTMYVADDQLVLDLYYKFYQSLKPNGALITSFITPPPYIDPHSSWDITDIAPAYLEIQENVFNKIFNAKWHGYRSTEQTFNLLTQAGFNPNTIKIYPDSNYIFPTVLVIK